MIVYLAYYHFGSSRPPSLTTLRDPKRQDHQVRLRGFAEYDYSWDPSSSSTGARTTTFDVDFVKYPFGYAKFDYMMRQVPLPSTPWASSSSPNVYHDFHYVVYDYFPRRPVNDYLHYGP